MNPDRRTLLRTVGLGGCAALAGCLDMGGGTETPTPGQAGIADFETLSFTVRNDPNWRDDAVGYAVVIDSESRQRAAFGVFSPDSDTDELRDFVEDVDYENERLLVVESGGPNSCYSRLDVENARVDDGRLRADASVVDTREGDEACASVETYPSTLVRVSFEDSPVDEAAIDVTDGWDEQATVTATADDSLSPDPADLSGHVRPDGDPSAVPPLDCDRDGVTRHGQWFDEADVAWGDFETDGETALSLRVEEIEYEHGDTASIQLTNVSDGNVATGNREKYNLQVYTDDGWQDVRVKEGDHGFGYTDEAINHPPGGGFRWDVELTEAGIVEGSSHDAEVCPDLQSGRYRFAYFGVIGDGAVAVSFELTV